MREPMGYTTGFVYFAQGPGDLDPIKIGWSTNPWVRLLEMQTANWAVLRLIGLIEIPVKDPAAGSGYQSLERRLHEHFAPFRIRGEWFRAETELFAYIDQHTRRAA